MLNLDGLERRLDAALEEDTEESLNDWLSSKRPMKAYGIYQGCIHEGGGAGSDLYIDIDKARMFLIQEVEEQNKNRSPEHRYKKVSKDRYQWSSDIITIQEFTIHK